MNHEAIRLLRQIRTCCVILASLAGFTFAWWFGPTFWESLRTAPLLWMIVFCSLAVLLFTALLIFAIRRNTSGETRPVTRG